MSWKNSTLSEISRIGDGAHASLKRVDSGIPYLTAKNITKSGVDYSNMDYISEETYNKHFKEKSNALTQPKMGDILYSIIGSIGGVYLVRDEKIGISSSVAIFRADWEKVLPHYLAYFLKSSSFDAQVQAIKGGVAQGFMSLEKLGTVNITYPEDIEYQKRIVDVLSAYDSLIENNQKQIKLLEEAAQRLYKEWFVDLHFPGYEDVEIVDGVPEGWKKERAECFFKITIGKTPPRAEKQWFVNGNNGIPWLSISDMRDVGAFIFDTREGLTEEAIMKHNMKIVPSGTIFVSFKLTVGRVAIATTEMCTNEAIAHFYVNDSLQAYTYCYLRNFEYDTLGNTSSISKAVNSKIIKAMPFIMPSQDIVEKFSGIVFPILSEIKAKQEMCNYLSEARDRLLPKLMSGEIEV